MSRLGLMVDRCIAPDSVPILVDLGNVNDQATRDRADAISAAGISRKNFSCEGNARLLLKLPPKKADVIFGAFPIVLGSTYWQTTHHWRGIKSGERIARVPTL